MFNFSFFIISSKILNYFQIMYHILKNNNNYKQLIYLNMKILKKINFYINKETFLIRCLLF